MARTKKKYDKDTQEKGTMPSNEEYKSIICPLTLASTTEINHKPLAVNYTCAFEPTISLDDGKPGAWYSSPKGRGHEQAFMAELKRRKELPEDDQEFISWDEDGYYFTQEEGEKAREAYEQMVLAGKITIFEEDGTPNEIPVKGNAKSWRNKHAGFTGVSWEDLISQHEDLYTTTTSKAKKDDVVIEDDEVESMVDEAELGETPLTQAQVQAEEELHEAQDLPEVSGETEEDEEDEDLEDDEIEDEVEETEDEIEEVETT